MGKNLSTEDPVSISGSGRFPGEREWLPTPAFLPGKLDGQRSLLGYSPWGCKESDMSDYARAHTHTRKVKSNTVLIECVFLQSWGYQ